MLNHINDFKFDWIKSIAITAERSNQNLIISIPSGTIICDPIDWKIIDSIEDATDPEQYESLPEFALSEIFKFVNHMRKDKENKNNFQKAIFIKNIELHSGSGEPLELPLMIVFIDQIIGVSLGKISE